MGGVLGLCAEVPGTWESCRMLDSSDSWLSAGDEGLGWFVF